MVISTMYDEEDLEHAFRLQEAGFHTEMDVFELAVLIHKKKLADSA